LVLEAIVVEAEPDAEPDAPFEVLETPVAVLAAADPEEVKAGGTTQKSSGQAPEEQKPEVTESQPLQQVGQEVEDSKPQGLQGAEEMVPGTTGGEQGSTAKSGQTRLQAPLLNSALLTQNPVPEQPQHW
jgi:hypothetical protein